MIIIEFNEVKPQASFPYVMVLKEDFEASKNNPLTVLFTSDSEGVCLNSPFTEQIGEYCRSWQSASSDVWHTPHSITITNV